MFFYSTRNQHNQKSLSQAIVQGLAEDGGLFVPAYFPQIELAQLDPNLDYPSFAALILAEYFKDDQLAPALAQICHTAFNFPLSLHSLNSNTAILELFHGPTLSFKDFGARFLAECLSHLPQKQLTTILVATSGDTGSAVASAFYRKPNLEVIVMFPYQQISPRQQQQICCWGENILSLAVNGSFDDCQALVKQAFSDQWWTTRSHISSANSINIARLLPQLTYYAYTSWQTWLASGTQTGFIIPSGNVGNATAAYWAKNMGFPIREITLATNANRVLGDYVATGKFAPHPSIATLANAMDVGNPSNFERLSHLYPDWNYFKANVRVIMVNDQQIRETIQLVNSHFNYVICPHTATAYFARQQLARLDDQPWTIAATADPCKFENILEPLIGKLLPPAPQLQQLFDRPSHMLRINPTLSAVQHALSLNT